LQLIPEFTEYIMLETTSKLVCLGRASKKVICIFILLAIKVIYCVRL